MLSKCAPTGLFSAHLRRAPGPKNVGKNHAEHRLAAGNTLPNAVRESQNMLLLKPLNEQSQMLKCISCGREDCMAIDQQV